MIYNQITLTMVYTVNKPKIKATVVPTKSDNDIIQLMHSFEVNIRICQPENSDVHRGEAKVNITFEG